jgi:hypothetical protein
MRTVLLWTAALMALPAPAAERLFNFGDDALDQVPPGFESMVLGPGQPGQWKVALTEAPPALKPITSRAPSVSRRSVLTQAGRDARSRRLLMLVYGPETYGDFKFTTRFKITGGALEQMAGAVFHFQNASNFYFVGASALEKAFRCYKVVDGEVKPPIGPALEISRDAWHDLGVQCEGTRIVCSLDGREAIKLIDATGNHPGKIGFCTGSDSVACFADARINYTPHELPAQRLVNEALQKYPRLLGLRIYAASAPGKPAVIIAGAAAVDLGRPAGTTEEDVIRRGTVYVARTRESATVTVPLRDRNGDPIAAIAVEMKTFPGQTEQNAAARAQPVVRRIQAQVQSREDLLQ